jgi:phage-related protein
VIAVGVANIIIDIAVRNRNASGEIDRTASSMDQFKQSMGAMVGPAKAAAVAVGGVAAVAVKYASDAQQATGGVNAVFKDNAQVIQDWAKTSAQAVGMSGAEFKTTAAGIGGALTGMGVDTAKAAEQTKELVQRGADLASVFGGTAIDATDAMTSAFRGEYDGLQRLIPSISAAAIEQEMAAEAAAGQTFASEEAAKASAIYNTIMNKSTDAAGNFAAEADTAAGAQQRAQAQFKDTAAALGEQLLPAITQVMTWLSQLGQWVSEHIPLVTTLGAVIGGLALAVLAVNAGLAIYSAAQTAATVVSALWSAAAGIGATATAAFGAAMAILTSPITLIIVAILAVIAVVVLLVKNWDTVAEAAGKAWDFIQQVAGAALDWLKQAAGSVLDWLKSAWTAVGDWIGGVWDKVKAAAKVAFDALAFIILAPIELIKRGFEGLKSAALAVWEAIKSAGVAIWSAIKSAAQTALDAIMWPINKIKQAIDAVINGIKSAISWASNLMSKIPFIGGLFGGSQMAPAPAVQRFWVPAGSSTPQLSGRAMASRSSGGRRVGNSLVINVNGALDPVGTARQIQRLLTAQQRRSNGVQVSAWQ